MSNEMKLLRAFIEASGYEVESISRAMLNGEEVKNKAKIALLPMLSWGDSEVEFITDYKVTKNHKSPFPWMDTNSSAWSAIVEYVLDYKKEIEMGEGGFVILKPVLDHFNGES